MGEDHERESGLGKLEVGAVSQVRLCFGTTQGDPLRVLCQWVLALLKGGSLKTVRRI